jgi:predicted nicotinamide N-methyase
MLQPSPSSTGHSADDVQEAMLRQRLPVPMLLARVSPEILVRTLLRIQPDLDAEYVLQIMRQLDNLQSSPTTPSVLDDEQMEQLTMLRCSILQQSPSRAHHLQSFLVRCPGTCNSQEWPLALRFHTTQALVSQGTTGRRIWDAAYILAHHLLAPQPAHAKIRAKAVVWELGAGVGFAGTFVATTLAVRGLGGCRVILSDLEDVVDNVTQPNLLLNQRTLKTVGAGVETAVLDWARPDCGLDVMRADLIIGSDLIYDPQGAKQLAALLNLVRQQNARCHVVLAQQIRRWDTLTAFLGECPWLSASSHHMHDGAGETGEFDHVGDVPFFVDRASPGYLVLSTPSK